MTRAINIHRKARCKTAVLRDHWKGSRDTQQPNILCTYQLTSRPRAGSRCDEPPTKLKLRVGPGGSGPRPPTGPAREAPSGIRKRRRRIACPPCRAAPTERRRRAGRGGRLCRAASHRRATSLVWLVGHKYTPQHGVKLLSFRATMQRQAAEQQPENVLCKSSRSVDLRPRAWTRPGVVTTIDEEVTENHDRKLESLGLGNSDFNVPH